MNHTIDIQKLAELSRLELSEEEARSFEEELVAFLRMAEALSEINTDRLPPAEHILPLCNVFREDTPHLFAQRDALLAAAKTTAEDYVTVPRVVDTKGQQA